MNRLDEIRGRLKVTQKFAETYRELLLEGCTITANASKDLLNTATHDVEFLLSRLDIAVEALEFYSNSGYERELEDRLGYIDPQDWLYSEPTILKDKGETAQNALAKITGQESGK